MFKHKLSPLNKIKIVLVGGGVIALILLIAYLSFSLRNSNVSNWTHDAAHSARQLAGWVDTELEQAKSRLLYISKLPSFASPLNKELVAHSLNGIPQGADFSRREVLDWTLKENSHGFSVLFVLFPNGDHYLSHPFSVQASLKTYNLSHRSYFQKSTIYKQPVLSNSFIGADGVPAIAIDIPITNASNEIESHLGGVLHLSMMSQLLGKQGRPDLKERYFLLDRAGNEVVKTGLDSAQFSQVRNLLKSRSSWQSLRGDYPYLTDLINPQSHDEQLVILVRLQSGWTLGVVSEVAAVSEQFFEDIRHTAFIAAFLLALIIGASIFLVQRIGGKWQLAEEGLRELNDQLEQRVEHRTEQLLAREKVIQDAKNRLQDIIEATQIGTWEWDLITDDCKFNQRWAEMVGYQLSELNPLNFSTWENLIHDDDLAHTKQQLKLQINRDIEQFSCEIRMKHKDGDWIWVLSQGRVSERGSSGEALRMSGTHTEITERKNTEKELQMAANVFSHAREGILITDAKGRIVDVNDTFTHLTGYSKEESLGQNPRFLKSGLQAESFYQELWETLVSDGHWSGEVWNRKKSGEFFAELLTISAVKESDGSINNYVALFSDITRSKMNEQRLEHVAHYDALTDLPNRVLLADRLNQALLLAQRKSEYVVVAYIDLDGFKQVNDRYGHDQGDLLLIEVARRMKACLRGSDTIARLGGDEFVAVLTGFKQIETSLPLLERLLDAASRPVMNKQRKLQVSASVGVTYYPQLDDVNEDQLLRQADQAMYQAKIEGKNRYHFFNPERDKAAKGFNESLLSIKKALENKEFVLYYQPKVNMRSGEIVGVEALIRWNHPVRGILPPAEFLPVIEGHELSVHLGDWVMLTALNQLSRWQSQGLSLSISINIGSLDIQQSNFIDKLKNALSTYPLILPSQIQLEILETSALEDVEQVSSTIIACQSLGVSFSLDDFGTGYSSLTYLKRLPATELKIDQSFVRDMLDDPDDLAILQGVLSLAQAFRRKVVAEGVESEAHGVMLLQLGCELGQGYCIAKPMPCEELVDWIDHWRPYGAWMKTPCFDSNQAVILNAIVEHRAWVRNVLDALLNPEISEDMVDLSKCALSRWFEQDGRDFIKRSASKALIYSKHDEMHHLAVNLSILSQQGNDEGLNQAIQSFKAVSQEMINLLEGLI